MFRMRSESGVHVVVCAYSHKKERWFATCSDGCDWHDSILAPSDDEEPARQMVQAHLEPIDEHGRRDLEKLVLRTRNAQRRKEGKPELLSLF